MADLVLVVAKSLVEGMLSKAQSAIEEESKLRHSTQRDLVFIAGEFHMMQSFLSITTEEHVRNNVVRSWVTQVRDLAYDVEDSIEFVIHLDTKFDWWHRLIPSWMRSTLPLDEAVGIIKDLKMRVQDVNQRKERYRLISDSGGPNPVMELTQPATVGSPFDMLAEARSTARKQQDMDALTKLVTRRDSDRQVISVCVSGNDLGAASKSMIRKAYDNRKIWGKFSYRAWVNVNLGNPFNLHEFLRSLIYQFHGDGSVLPMEKSLDDQFAKVKEQLNNKTYLLVLEDLTTNVDWKTILEYLSDRRNRSCIVALTQEFQVASYCMQVPYIPHFWSDYSLCVFSEDNQGPLIGRMSEIIQLPKYPAKARMDALQVMSVCGIPGAGKSALVRNLYRNQMSQNNIYAKYIWVDVYHPFNLVDFCKSLLMQFRSRSLETDEDPVKQCHGLLKDEQCLLVIDNLQSTEDWDLIHGALAFRPSGSAIVVITNEERIALHCADRKDLVFHGKPLEAGAAIDLFKMKVEGSYISVNDVEKDPVLQQLIPKCGGLPKVIVALADVLGQTFNWAEQARILNDNFVHNLETRPEFACLQGLFSWLHSYLGGLPKHLRQHVAYLLIFPGDRSIRRRRLVMRWGAEGYSTDCESYTADENGEELFSRLVKETMIQPPPCTTVTNMRMDSFEVNAMFREYMISRPLQENIATAIELYALKGTCSPTSRRRGRHLVIEQSWDRDRIVFKNIDFSKLRSLTVFGKWEEFFISESMKVLRVLDLEDASGVTNKDLKNMLKLLPCLKFLSVRGCSEINYLPSSVGELRQLQILDVRYTNIVTIPASITKLKKLQYIRAGPTAPPEDASVPHTVAFKLSELRRCLQLVGVEVMSGFGELTALHTLGVINISEVGGKVILKELGNLTQLRKLGVSGVSKKNGKEFCSAVLCHSRLESLSVWLNVDNEDCLDSMLPENTSETSIKLQSLKLYGPLEKLPKWINKNRQLCNLKKLNLELDVLSKNDIKVLGELQELCILRLRVKPSQEDMLSFCVVMEGVEDHSYKRIKVLEIASRSSLQLTFGSAPRAMQNLELLYAGCCTNGSPLQLDGLEHLFKLKEVRVIGSNDETLKTNLEQQFANRTSKPALKLENILPRTESTAGPNDQHYSFPFYCTTRSSPGMQSPCQ
ncbi:unnamed protein product [Urochloa humidicola]